MNITEIKNRVSLFIILWCIANIFHSISFISLENGISNPEILRIIILFLCVGQIFYIKKCYFFLPALFLSSLIVIILPGSVPNHIFFEGLINITILSFSVFYFIKYYFCNLSIDEIQSRIYKIIAPFIRVSVIVLYFFVVLHKLNYGFFDPYISCSGDFFSRILEDFGLTQVGVIDEFHTNNFILLRNFSIYFAIISEAIIPLLLIFKRFRNIGIAYGIFFHIILAFHFHGGIYSFSVMMYVYYTLFFNKSIVETFSRYFNKPVFKYIVIGVLAFISILYVIIPNDSSTLFFRSTTKLLFIGLIFFMCYSIFYFIIFLKNFKPIKGIVGRSDALGFNINTPTFLVVLFLFFNGMSPYLGLKTEVCFSMFSNLQTEANLNNHFFISSKLRVFPYQDELITIKSSNIEYLNSYAEDQDKRMVSFEFNKIINLNDNFYILYEYQGKSMKIEKNNGKLSGDLVKVYSNYVLNKFMSFRPVFVNNKCQH